MKRLAVWMMVLAALALVPARTGAGVLEEKKKVDAYKEAALKEPGAVKTSSGLIFRTLRPGDGPSPKATSTVKVHYEGTFIDGKVFDSSLQRGEPAEFPLNGVIRCWTEALQRMKVGEKAKLVCPPGIAYGDRGSPPSVPPGSTLVFEVELLEIVK
jgi:FKBP-type peptidyl-prolyl cis-trans isomerase FkpA